MFQWYSIPVINYLKSVALYSGDSISKGREIANIFGDTSIQNWF